jgi:hypothetical protein
VDSAIFLEGVIDPVGVLVEPKLHHSVCFDKFGDESAVSWVGEVSFHKLEGPFRFWEVFIDCDVEDILKGGISRLSPIGTFNVG